MGMFEMSEEQVAEWREKCRELVQPRVGGEEVLAAAVFRQGGATANYVASKAQLGGAVYAGIKMLRKKKAGGLPDKVMIAVTPAKVYAFKPRSAATTSSATRSRAGIAAGSSPAAIAGRNDGADDRVALGGREGDAGRDQRQGRPGQPGADGRAAGEPREPG